MVALNGQGRIGFYCGNVSKLREEACTLQPTIFYTVPRLLARIRQGVFQKVAESRFKTALLNRAIKQKLKSVNKSVLL